MGKFKAREVSQEYLNDILISYENGESVKALSKRLAVSQNFIRYRLIKNNIKIRNRQDSVKSECIIHNYFEQLDSEEKAYWLGFLIADGCIFKNMVIIQLGAIDEGHLVKFRNCVNSDSNIYKCRGSAYTLGYGVRIQVSSPQIVNDLKKFGIVPNKTKICKKPEGIPIELERHFWRGCIDGDGCITTPFLKRLNRRVPKLHLCGTYDLVSEFNKYCCTVLGVPGNKVSYSKGGNNYEIAFTPNRTMALLNHFYGDCTISLDRKYAEFLKVKSEFKMGRINKVCSSERLT